MEKAIINAKQPTRSSKQYSLDQKVQEKKKKKMSAISKKEK